MKTIKDVIKSDFTFIITALVLSHSSNNILHIDNCFPVAKKDQRPVNIQ